MSQVLGSAASSNTNTAAHTLAAGTLGNRIVLCFGTSEHPQASGAPAAPTWTYGGVAVTLLDTAFELAGSFYQVARVGYVLEDDLPADGVNNVVFSPTESGAQGRKSYAVAFEGCPQEAPTTTKGNGTSGTSTSFQVGPYTVANGSAGGCVAVSNGATFTLDAGWNEFGDGADVGGDAGGVAGYQDFSAGATPTLTFTLNTGNRCAGIVAIIAPLSTNPDPDSVDVSSGPAAGGTDIEITGTNFDAAGGSSEGVTVGGAEATNVVFVNATTITCTTPAGTPGARDIVVTNGNGATGTLVGGFFYEGTIAVESPVASDESGEAESDLTSTRWAPSGMKLRQPVTATCEGVTLGTVTIRQDAP